MRFDTKDFVEWLLDCIEMAVLLFSVNCPGVYVTKLALRLSPSLCDFVQRRYKDNQISNRNDKEISNE